VRPAHDLPPGRADRSPSREQCPLVTTRVALARLVRAVHLPSVGLNDHPLPAPEEIGPDRRFSVPEVDPLVDSRIRYAEPAAQSQESLLERAGRHRASDVMLFKNFSDPASGRPRRVACELILDGPQVEDFRDVGLVKRSLELAAIDDVG
jgi:hypothetical protein